MFDLIISSYLSLTAGDRQMPSDPLILIIGMFFVATGYIVNLLYINVILLLYILMKQKQFKRPKGVLLGWVLLLLGYSYNAAHVSDIKERNVENIGLSEFVNINTNYELPNPAKMFVLINRLAFYEITVIKNSNLFSISELPKERRPTALFLNFFTLEIIAIIETIVFTVFYLKRSEPYKRTESPEKNVGEPQ